MRIRVWAYRDGVLLPDGFEADAKVGAEIPCLVALLESLGVEVCIGDDDEGCSNQDVDRYIDVSED